MGTRTTRFVEGVMPAIGLIAAAALLGLAAYGGWGLLHDVFGPSAPAAEASAGSLPVPPSMLPALGPAMDGDQCRRMHEAMPPSQCQQMHEAMGPGQPMQELCTQHMGDMGQGIMGSSMGGMMRGMTGRPTGR